MREPFWVSQRAGRKPEKRSIRSSQVYPRFCGRVNSVLSTRFSQTCEDGQPMMMAGTGHRQTHIKSRDYFRQVDGRLGKLSAKAMRVMFLG